MGTDRIELYYLHASDPQVPLAESAEALKEMLDGDNVRAVGVSNCGVKSPEIFVAICPLSAFPVPYNLLQRNIEKNLLT